VILLDRALGEHRVLRLSLRERGASHLLRVPGAREFIECQAVRTAKIEDLAEWRLSVGQMARVDGKRMRFGGDACDGG
jgi:hypothetical protein